MVRPSVPFARGGVPRRSRRVHLTRVASGAMRLRGSRGAGRWAIALGVVCLAGALGGPVASASDMPSVRALQVARGSLRWVEQQIETARADEASWQAVLDQHDRTLDDVYARLSRTERRIRAAQTLDGATPSTGVAEATARADRLRNKIDRIAADPSAAVALRRAVGAQGRAESFQDDLRRARRLVELLSSRSLLERDSLTREDWARLFLGWMAAPPCQDNLRVLVAWQVQESTAAAWNPLATTIDAASATGTLNDAGVREFGTLDDGLRATRRTLLSNAPDAQYDWIRYGLQTCQPIAVTARYVHDSAWCWGCAGGAYVTGLIGPVQANYPSFRDTRLGAPSPGVAPVVAPGAPIAVCPLLGEYSFTDSFGAPRSGGRTHEGIDLISPMGTPIVAAHPGTVFYGWNTLGGNAAYVRADDGTYTYYAHLSAFGDVYGQSVPAGTVIGYVGETGDASGPHLHFEYHPGGGPAIDPYDLLLAVC